MSFQNKQLLLRPRVVARTEKRHIVLTVQVGLTFLCALSAVAAAGPVSLTIPKDHPRLWWTPTRIAEARKWYTNNHFTPNSDDYLAQATLYVLTGDARFCSMPTKWASELTVHVSGVASDEARWAGETVILVFDWCYETMTPLQRSAITTKWNGYTEVLNAKKWGGPGMESNNYYWAYLRNSFEWGVATYHEQRAVAQQFLDDALITRWQNGLLRFFAGKGRGGVFQEGSEYGAAMASYPVVPWVSAGLMGRNILRETNFYREAITYLTYMITPHPVFAKGRATPYYQVLAFNDDENNQSAASFYWGDFMAMVQEEWRGTRLGMYAQQWLNLVRPPMHEHVRAIFRPGPALDFETLPLDYYAPGVGFLFAKNKWGRGSTFVQIQGGLCSTCGHNHADMGNFHLARNGYWLTKESTDYYAPIAGWGGAGNVGVEEGPAHNVMFYDGKGPVLNYRIGVPTTLRLESRPDYAYMAVDLSSPFHSMRPEFDVGVAKTTVREYLFVRSLEALVVLDRMQSTIPITRKGVAVHTENRAVVQGRKATAVNGTEVLDVVSLLPSPVVIRSIDEGARGRHRLEIEYPGGETQTYFLTVLQARNHDAQSLAIDFVQDSGTITVTMRHPKAGTATIVFVKGAGSVGGRVGYSRSDAVPQLVPLLDQVQGITVDDNGPAWTIPLRGSIVTSAGVMKTP